MAAFNETRALSRGSKYITHARKEVIEQHNGGKNGQEGP